MTNITRAYAFEFLADPETVRRLESVFGRPEAFCIEGPWLIEKEPPRGHPEALLVLMAWTHISRRALREREELPWTSYHKPNRIERVDPKLWDFTRIGEPPERPAYAEAHAPGHLFGGELVERDIAVVVDAADVPAARSALADLILVLGPLPELKRLELQAPRQDLEAQLVRGRREQGGRQIGRLLDLSAEFDAWLRGRQK